MAQGRWVWSAVLVHGPFCFSETRPARIDTTSGHSTSSPRALASDLTSSRCRPSYKCLLTWGPCHVHWCKSDQERPAAWVATRQMWSPQWRSQLAATRPTNAPDRSHQSHEESQATHRNWRRPSWPKHWKSQEELMTDHCSASSMKSSSSSGDHATNATKSRRSSHSQHSLRRGRHRGVAMLVHSTARLDVHRWLSGLQALISPFVPHRSPPRGSSTTPPSF